ncbi:MAG: DUF4384 domain-containing protein [Zoogloea oleivorans]|jgi:serine/threonine protein kinase|uniref:DUF4384 domain-containing protein n=1 Tax=Zoogloea oleivorans TaxID=1552750 RepID=UPI002A36D4CA|nr:DUF4384 domain-containing protein [Zoogloea oleivorans]MDY0037314.1 DUF4384 domain-containing protein [Zoogloea oleivorans]
MSNLEVSQLLQMFDPLHRSDQERANGAVLISRYHADGKTLILKKYRGALSHLETREFALMVTISARYAGSPHVEYNLGVLRSARFGETTLGTREIDMRWLGFDLQDWGKLLPVAQNELWCNPTFLLQLLRGCINGLYRLHAIGLIHCDIKADNICLGLDHRGIQETVSGWVGEIHPDHVKIIDFGIAIDTRDPDSKLPDLAGMLAPAGRSNRLVDAHEDLSRGNAAPMRQLDWRIDCYSLALLFEAYKRQADKLSACLHGPASHQECLNDLLYELNAVECEAIRGDPPPAELPHPAWLELIDRALQESAPPAAWTFRVPEHVLAVAPETGAEPTTLMVAAPAPEPEPEPKTGGSASVSNGIGAHKRKLAAGILALAAVAAYPSVGERLQEEWTSFKGLWAAGEIATTAGDPQVPARPVAILRSIQSQAKGPPVTMQLDKAAYQVGEAIRLTVEVPRDGLLTILQVDPDGPVTLFHPLWKNVAVKAGDRFDVPASLPNGKSAFTASEPAGRTDLLAVLTPPGSAAPNWTEIIDATASRAKNWENTLGRYMASALSSFMVQAAGTPKRKADVTEGPLGIYSDGTLHAYFSPVSSALELKVCLEGAQYHEGRCLGTPRLFTLEEAIQATEKVNRDGFAGHANWRLPRSTELGDYLKVAEGFRNADQKARTKFADNMFHAGERSFETWMTPVGGWDTKTNLELGNGRFISKSGRHPLRLIRDMQ